MTEKDILLRDIDTVKATINRDWHDITSLSLSHDERTALRAHIEHCVQELRGLLGRLDALSPASQSDIDRA